MRRSLIVLLVAFMAFMSFALPVEAHHRNDHQRPKDSTTTSTSASTSTSTSSSTTSTSTTSSTTSTTLLPQNEPVSQFGYSLTFGPEDIVCDGTYRVQILYGYVADTPNRYGQSDVMNEIRDAAYDASGIMNSEAEIHSNDRNGSRVRYTCTSGRPTILNAGEFPADGGYPDTTSFRQRLCDLGFSNPARVYLVTLDGYAKTNYASSTCNGARYSIVSLRGSDPLLPLLSQERAVITRETFLHEMLHNFGAVPLGAPNRYTYRGGHCKEGRDIMCYGPENDTSFCPDRTWVDCNGQDYFNPTPAPGTWLYDNPALNVGHCVEPFTSCAYTGRGKEPVEDGEVPPFQPVFDVLQEIL